MNQQKVNDPKYYTEHYAPQEWFDKYFPKEKKNG